MTNVQCTGSERMLTSCTATFNATVSCTHAEDVAVQCTTGIKLVVCLISTNRASDCNPIHTNAPTSSRSHIGEVNPCFL